MNNMKESEIIQGAESCSRSSEFTPLVDDLDRSRRSEPGGWRHAFSDSKNDVDLAKLGFCDHLDLIARGSGSVESVYQPFCNTSSDRVSAKVDEFLTYSSDRLHPKEGINNPIAPPGLPGGDEDFVLRSGRQWRNWKGDITNVYEGLLLDKCSGLYRERFKAASTFAPNEQILSQSIIYAGDGEKLTFDAGAGRSVTIDHVCKVDTKLNDARSSYLTFIQTREGRKFEAITDLVGNVFILKEKGTSAFGRRQDSRV